MNIVTSGPDGTFVDSYPVPYGVTPVEFVLYGNMSFSAGVNNSGWWVYQEKVNGKKFVKKVRHVLNVTCRANVGDVVCFKGNCPSGETFQMFDTWDGTEEMFDKLCKEAQYTRDILVLEKEHKENLFYAEMRTSSL